MKKKNILDRLNDKQRVAVEQIEGPIMVLAGAGSGKTRVLTYRVAHLINQGIDPMNILALTFTNKAAKEMKERIINLVDNKNARNVWMGTFHSIFARILRIEGARLGYPSHFTIYDTEDSKRLMKAIIDENQLDNKIYIPNYVLNRISSAKTSLVTSSSYNQNPEFITYDKMTAKPKIGLLYSLYQNRCFKASAMDFDDLLLNTFILFRDFPDILYKYQQKFMFILVDEYQDTNFSQYMIIKKLAANNENICVVGDDAQSIYAFRGATIKNILNFKNDYPDLKTIKLEENYRSTKTIVNAANSIIVNNKEQLSKEIWTNNESGNKISLIQATTDNEEGTLVANSIFEHKMNQQLKNDSFAILYRTNAQSRAFEEALRKLNIPYKIYGGLSFYKRKEIKDLLAYIRLVINNNDEGALVRAINFPSRGIGKTSLQKIIIASEEQNKSLWQVIEQMPKQSLTISTATQNKIATFVTMIKSFSVQLNSKNAYALGREIASTSGILKTLYEDQSPEGFNRFENIEELLNAIKDFSEKDQGNIPIGGDIENEFRGLAEFMQDVALLTDADTSNKENPDHVSLMTVHAAKGLEFPFVFIVGIEENLFPSIQSLNSIADLEEERRLFYVALTRAQKKVTLSYTENRYRWGNLTLAEPSRFIDEIKVDLIESPQKASIHLSKTKGFGGTNKKITQANFLSHSRKKLKKLGDLSNQTNESIIGDEMNNLQTGMLVAHQRFGKGKVINVDGAGPNRKATVFFPNIGQKQLLLKFAKLKIIKSE
ncbi:MAG: UvrD-helicase domain-containing protein [Bacteroidales bacterium]|nr:UvrD-helicase domain-containing protein [Bacteroidales bacterium]